MVARVETQSPLADQKVPKHKDIFAWSHKDMLGINNAIIEYRLGVDSIHKPVRQKIKSFNTEKYVAINEDVKKLLAASFIREANYPQ